MQIAPVLNKTALVTGCSSGIGTATALRLRSAGWTVITTARKRQDLDRLEREGFAAVELDLAGSDAVTRAAAEALDHAKGTLGALVNNAGFGQAGAIEDLSRGALRRQFEVNLFGAIELTNHVLPGFRAQGYGRIVNVSSLSGFVAVPFFGAYAASKHALEAVTDALRVELIDSGVWVSLVEPGPISTAFRENLVDKARSELDFDRSVFGSFYARRIAPEGVPERKGDSFTKPPEAVAEKILHALESSRPRRRYLVTFPAYLLYFLRRAAPTAVLDRFVARMVGQ